MPKIHNYPRLALLYFVFIMISLEVNGANYYFSTSMGDDSRSSAAAQNPNTPWRSIDKLNEIFVSLKPGDRVLFRRGEKFYGSITINQSGQPNNPIKIGAYGEGAKPVITSMVEIKKWEGKGNNLYEARVEGVSGELAIVTIGGLPFAMGRYPNLSEENAGYLTIDNHNGNNRISATDWRFYASFTGGEIVIRKNRWIIDRHFITFHSSSSFQYDPDGSKYKPQKGYGFFIQNHPETLDELGEWYHDRPNEKLLIYYPKASPPLENVRVATKDFLVNIRHQIKFIEIRGLVFEGANQNNIELENTENISILNCEIRYTGKNAINVIASPHFTLRNSIIRHSYNGGVFLQWSDNYPIKSTNAIISNNVFEHTFQFAGMGRSSDSNGIAIYMSESTHSGLIEYNKIVKTGYIGINFNGNNTVVKNNVLDTFCSVKDDGAGIYTWTGLWNTKSINRKVIGNILINGIGANKGTNSNPLDKGAAEGIYIDDNATGVEVSENSILNMANSGIFIHNANNINISNNRVYDAQQSILLVHDDVGEPIRNLVVNGNQFLAKYRNQKLIRVDSKADDIQQMGRFKNNIYAHPLNQADLISVNSKNASGEMVWKEFDLEFWKDTFQHDLNSKLSPIKIQNFEIKSTIGVNQIPNGDFESSSNYLYCWSSDYNCNIQIEEKDGLVGKSLKVNFPSRAFVAFSIGEVAKRKRYHFSLTALGSETGFVKTYIRQSESPYHVISDIHTLKVSAMPSDFSILFSNQVNEENAVIIIETVDSHKSFWLDNLVLRQVEAEVTDPEAYFLFEYNETPLPKRVSVPGTYVDLDNNPIFGTINIDPFSSVILIKKSDQIASLPDPISKIEWLSPDPNTQIFEGATLSLRVAVDKYKTGDVEKINYYSCETLISTKTEDPFSYTWNDVPYGHHYLHVEALDKYGRLIRSDSTHVEVKKQNVAPVVHITSSTNSSKILEGGSFNINGSALDLDGSIALVQLFANEQLIGTASTSPFDFTWNNIPKGSYALTVRAIDSEQLVGDSDPIHLFVVENTERPIDELIYTEGYSLFVNLGSKTDVSWLSQAFTGEDTVFSHINGKTSNYSDATITTNALFQTERNGNNFTITVPVPNGIYIVKTYHNELWFGKEGPEARTGQRVYDISLQQKIVKERFDLFSENGNQPTVLIFEEVIVTNGFLALGLKAHANNASISALAIIQEFDETVEPEVDFLKIDQTSATKVLMLKTGYAFDVVHNGETFKSDSRFNGYYGKSDTFSNIKASERALFQTERNAQKLTFSIPVLNGIYTVRTYHNELFFGHSGTSARAGRRVFDISMENVTVKKGFDLYVESENQPTVLTFENIIVADGYLNIEMVASANEATVSGISIYKLESNDIIAPEVDQTFFLNTGGKFDELYNGYVFTAETNLENYDNATSWGFSNDKATDEKLFQTEWNSGNLSYKIPDRDGKSTIYTMHNELWLDHSEPSVRQGRRVYDISIEGEIARNDFDIYDGEGGNKTITSLFQYISATDRVLNLDLVASQNRDLISDIAIVGKGAETAMNGAQLKVDREMINKRGYRRMEGFIEADENQTSQEEIRIYPNPAKDKVTIELNAELSEVRILIHNMVGQLISQFDVNWLSLENNRYTLPLDNMSQGVYLVTVTEKLEVLKRLRIMVTP